jgi:hypothetical protein
VQAADDGHPGLLLHVYFKLYMTTAVFTSRTMQKRRLHKIFRHLWRYLEASLHFFLRGQNTAATLYTLSIYYKSSDRVNLTYLFIIKYHELLVRAHFSQFLSEFGLRK